MLDFIIIDLNLYIITLFHNSSDLNGIFIYKIENAIQIRLFIYFKKKYSDLVN